MARRLRSDNASANFCLHILLLDFPCFLCISIVSISLMSDGAHLSTLSGYDYGAAGNASSVPSWTIFTRCRSGRLGATGSVDTNICDCHSTHLRCTYMTTRGTSVLSVFPGHFTWHSNHTCGQVHATKGLYKLLL